MKSIWKVLALCLCFCFVISMCACKSGGGGKDSGTTSGQWTTGSCVAQYMGARDKHYFSFMSDGVVAFFDTETNVIDRPYKTGTWDAAKDSAAIKAGTKDTEFKIDGTTIKISDDKSFEYKCDHATVKYTLK